MKTEETARWSADPEEWCLVSLRLVRVVGFAGLNSSPVHVSCV